MAQRPIARSEKYSRKSNFHSFGVLTTCIHYDLYVYSYHYLIHMFILDCSMLLTIKIVSGGKKKKTKGEKNPESL